MSDLRTLAQAVVDAPDDDGPWRGAETANAVRDATSPRGHMTMWMYAVMSKSTGCLYGEWEAESPDVAAARCLDYYGTRRDRPSREDMDIIPMSRAKPGPKGFV